MHVVWDCMTMAEAVAVPVLPPTSWTVMRMSYYAEAFAQEAQMGLAHGVIVGLGENKVSFV